MAEFAFKTCVVTGASAGIGLATSVALAEKGAAVVMVCRPSAHLQAAVAAVERAGGALPTVIAADLARLSQVEAGAHEIIRRCPRVDVLVHNAGVWPMARELTEDGFEQAFAVNHLAPFVLNQRLRRHLALAPHARIVQVTAGLYSKGRVDLEATPNGGNFHRLRTYADTKLWNLLATLDLARCCEGSNITVNAVHPGVVRTGLGASRSLIGGLLWLAKRTWLSPSMGARGPVRLALDVDVRGINGALYDQLRPMSPAPVAVDDSLARQVVAETNRLLERASGGQAATV